MIDGRALPEIRWTDVPRHIDAMKWNRRKRIGIENHTGVIVHDLRAVHPREILNRIQRLFMFKRVDEFGKRPLRLAAYHHVHQTRAQYCLGMLRRKISSPNYCQRWKCIAEIA